MSLAGNVKRFRSESESEPRAARRFIQKHVLALDRGRVSRQEAFL